MDATYITREYEAGDEKKIVDLLNISFEGWPKFDLATSKLEHWKWKYQERHTQKTIVVSEIDGKIIGSIHTMPQKMNILGNTYLCSLGGDAAVHPHYRRSGIQKSNLKKITSLRKRNGIKISYAITGNPIIINMFEKLPEWNILPFQLSHYVRINDLDLHLKKKPIENAWVQKIGYNVLKTLSDIKKIFTSSTNSQHSSKISLIESFDDKINDFWEEIQNDYDLILEYNKEYLNWRYLAYGNGSFIVLQAEENEKIVGFIVLRINTSLSDYPIGYIVDLLTGKDRSDVVDSLIRESLTYFESMRVNIINLLVIKGYSHRELLEKYGFLDSRRNHHIYYTSLQDEDPFQKIIDSPSTRIHFSFGNLDVV